jgi:hypothetical protein
MARQDKRRQRYGAKSGVEGPRLHQVRDRLDLEGVAAVQHHQLEEERRAVFGNLTEICVRVYKGAQQVDAQLIFLAVGMDERPPTERF